MPPSTSPLPSAIARRLDSESLGIAIRDLPDGRFLAVNDVLCSLLGLPRASLINRTAAEAGFSGPLANGHGLPNDSRPLVYPSELQRPDEQGRVRRYTLLNSVAEQDGQRFLVSVVQPADSALLARPERPVDGSPYQRFFAVLPVPVIVMDVDRLEVVAVNPAACELYGYSAEEFQSLSRADWAHMTGATSPEEFERLMRVEPAEPVVRRHVTRDGRALFVEITVLQFTYAGRHLRLGVFRDQTRRLELESASQDGRVRAEALAALTSDAMYVTDYRTGAVQWNHGLTTLFGYRPEDAQEAGWWLERIHPDDREEVNRTVQAAMASGASGWSAEYRFRKADETYAFVLVRSRIERDDEGKPVTSTGAVIDITSQIAMAQAAERAAALERQRLARDLHDSVTQMLYSATLLTTAAERQAAAGREAEARESSARARTLSQQALRRLRLLVHELRPPEIEALGLERALRQRLQSVEERTDVATRLDVEPVGPLPLLVQDQLFRIAEEALNNALRHASATRLWVRLWSEDGRVHLSVEDNGTGFSPQQVGPGGLGLTYMRERAQWQGGTLEVSSRPGQGTTVSASLPVQRD